MLKKNLKLCLSTSEMVLIEVHVAQRVLLELAWNWMMKECEKRGGFLEKVACSFCTKFSGRRKMQICYERSVGVPAVYVEVQNVHLKWLDVVEGDAEVRAAIWTLQNVRRKERERERKR